MLIKNETTPMVIGINDARFCLECRVVFRRDEFQACPQCAQEQCVLPLAVCVERPAMKGTRRLPWRSSEQWLVLLRGGQE